MYRTNAIFSCNMTSVMMNFTIHGHQTSNVLKNPEIMVSIIYNELCLNTIAQGKVKCDPNPSYELVNIDRNPSYEVVSVDPDPSYEVV